MKISTPPRFYAPILLALVLAACGGDDPAGPRQPDPVATSLVVTPDPVDLAMAATRQLSLTVVDQLGEPMNQLPAGFTPHWSSDDTAVVTIDASGLVRGVRIGQTSIRVAAGSLQKSVTARVLDVTPQLESQRAVSLEVGPEGGVLETQSNAGIGYRLEIPPLALAEPTTVTLTPISELANAPFLTLRGGARFAPDGLVLREPARLIIDLPDPPPLSKLIGVGFPNDGSSLSLHPINRSGTQATLLVPHFSGAGVANLEDGSAVAPPAEEDPSVTAVFDLAATASNGAPDANTVATILRRWYQDGVRPTLQAAASSFSSLDGAVSEWRLWFGMITTFPELAAEVLDALAGEIEEARDLATTALRSRIDYLNVECVTERDWLLALLALDVQRMAEEFGLANEANGLDRASFLESLCFEIGYAAVELPTEVVQGVPVELEFRAGLSYGGGAPDDFTAPLRTTVSVSGGMASPDSLTLSDGIGTVMVTPDGPSVNVTLHTCFDYDAPPPSALQLSAVCADTTIAGHAGVVLLVSTRHRVTAHAWVGYVEEPIIEEDLVDDVSGQLVYENELSASVNHEVAGSSSATGGATGTITFGAGNELTSIVSTGQASLMKQGLAGSPTAESFGIVSVHFDVVGAARAVHIAGTIFARPQDGASAVRTEQARAEIGLRRVNPSNNATLEVMLSAQSWNGDPPPDVTIVLQPGRYQFSTNARANTGAGCSQCSFTAESAVQATLTFE